ncbi:MAG: hypothetical protein LBR53_02140 [Deltaproteobacteria bacterium]|jgi:hypothetical protein|nr:hypothetical protein [Deltaproteobacteria bacterium]
MCDANIAEKIISEFNSKDTKQTLVFYTCDWKDEFVPVTELGRILKYYRNKAIASGELVLDSDDSNVTTQE